MTSEAERSAARTASLVRSGMVGVGARVGITFAALAVQPLLVRAMGGDTYGAYATIVALTGFLSFADFGIGNGLINLVAAGRAAAEPTPDVRIHISNALALLSGIAIAVVGVATFAWMSVDWTSIVDTDVGSEELAASVALFGILFGLGIPAAVGQKVHLGLQRGHVANMWLLTGYFLGTVGSAVAALANASLPLQVVAFVGPTVATSWVQTIHVLTREPGLRPRLNDISLKRLAYLVQRSWMFFIMAVCLAVSYQADLSIVSAVMGTTAAAVLAVSLRMFTAVQQIFYAAMNQLWPAFADAHATNDRAWTVRTLKKSVLFAAAAGALGFGALALALPWAVRVLFGNGLEPPTLLVVALGLWYWQQAANYPLAMFLNGIQASRFQSTFVPLFAGVNLCFSIWLTHRIGLSGPIWASLITHTLLNLIPSLWFIRRSLAQGSTVSTPLT